MFCAKREIKKLRREHISTKDSLRELYHESRQKIRMVLGLLGRIEASKAPPLPEESSLATMSHLILTIRHHALYEPENQYRNAIIEISTWLGCALTLTYLEDIQKKNNNALYLLKKGAEILHSFLHRDLRRKQFTSEEAEIFQNYLALMGQLPRPPRSTLEDFNQKVEMQLKKSS